MYTSTATGRSALLVDIETGTVLNAPPETTVSERWVDTHPFIERDMTGRTGDDFVIAGPDAKLVAGGCGGVDYVLYHVVRSQIGTLYLVRES